MTMESRCCRSGRRLPGMVVVFWLGLTSQALAAQAGELCGRAGGWSRSCEQGLRCEIRWRFVGVRLGLCVEDARICGGLQGTACAAEEFCDIPVEAMCGAADQTGICRPRPAVCTEQYEPVCGCDGQTYGNRCAANAAGVSVAAEGRCDLSTECNVDTDCPHGACQIGSGDPILGRCTVCGDGFALTCEGAPPICPVPAEQVREIVNGCYGTCVDRRTCQPGCKFEGAFYDIGEKFPGSTGCNPCTCYEPGIATCSYAQCICDEYDNIIYDYVSRDPALCNPLAFEFKCSPGTQEFRGGCGCGCLTRL